MHSHQILRNYQINHQIPGLPPRVFQNWTCGFPFKLVKPALKQLIYVKKIGHYVQKKNRTIIQTVQSNFTVCTKFQITSHVVSVIFTHLQQQTPQKCRQSDHSECVGHVCCGLHSRIHGQLGLVHGWKDAGS